MGLRQNILTEPVSELNLRQVVTVSPETTIGQAIARMREGKLGCVIVCSEDGKPQGLFTERQVIRLLLEGTHVLDQPVKDHLATPESPTDRNAPIGDMTQKMLDRGLRFIIVTDEQGKATGISGQKSFVEFIAEHFPRQIKVQRMQSKLYMDEREGA